MIYNIPYKALIDSKPLRVRFNQIDGFIKKSMMELEIQYCLARKNMMQYEANSEITYIFSHYFAKIKVNSYDSIPIDKKIDFAKC